MKRPLKLITVSFLLLLFSFGLQAQSLTPTQLFAFACDSTGNSCPDGAFPNSLLQSADLNFYGTTPAGGTGNQAQGTVFKITPSGQLTVLFTFVADQNGAYPNGAQPSSLVEGNDGFLYGAALQGGPNNTGLIFKLSKTGTLTILNSAVGYKGLGPTTLVLGADGNLYGGTFGDAGTGGSLFRVTPSGAYKLLHAFNLPQEGPMTMGMTLASDGNLYGTTLGDEDLLTTFFRLTTSGKFTILQTLHYGQFPVSPPVQASDGKLYGGMSRFEGQAEAGLFGTSFSGKDFQDILAPQLQFGDYERYLTPASDSNLWSVVDHTNLGTIEVDCLSLNGTLLQTATFNGANGEYPDAALVQASDGSFFGVTELGGSVPQGEVANGVVFTLHAGLAPPDPTVAAFKPAHGKAGKQILIQGTHFVGTTAVAFNGVSATFTVLNAGFIMATVPHGATTGPIAVTNPGGTAASNTDFTVN
jgi:uncharacterized repeat protein (TIGR03803 family)